MAVIMMNIKRQRQVAVSTTTTTATVLVNANRYREAASDPTVLHHCYSSNKAYSHTDGSPRYWPLLVKTGFTIGISAKELVPSKEATAGQRCRRRTERPASPANILVCPDLAVHMRQTRARLESLVCDVFRGGVVRTELDLLAPGVGVVGVCLSAGARKMLATPNAGGSSILSEALSCELLGRCYGAKLLKTETEVEYWPEGGSITDYTCSMFDTHLGVSVTRAMTFRGLFTSETACRLLNKKLRGLIESSQNAVDRWSKQILHVWATSPHVAGVTERAYRRLGSDVTSNTVVLITVASNADQVFFNQKKTKVG